MQNTEKEFPINVQKSELARALKISMSGLQDMLNRRYIEELKPLDYCPDSKYIGRRVLHFLRSKMALLPEDFEG